MDIVLEAIIYHILNVVEEGADRGTVWEVAIAVYIKAISIVKLRIEVNGTSVETITDRGHPCAGLHTKWYFPCVAKHLMHTLPTN